MDYKFFRELGGQPVAQCESEASTFGDWLSSELSNDDAAVSEVLDVIDKLQSKQLTSHKIKGQDYTLILDQDEAELHSHLGYFDEDKALPEGTVLDQQTAMGCGLQDLKELMLEWRQFTKDE
jgi:uncharacterized protein YacL (UPF0231 family)